MPNEQKVTRKLKAILSADVKGYSLLMTDDEVHTIQALKVYRQIMSDLITHHSGRVVDDPGDNLLAEFGSAVDAVECAVQVQNKLKKENARYVENNRLEFRIGINIGDVVQDGDRIYGEGVNVAARIESLAEPAGIYISRNTYDHVKSKMDLGFEYMGEHDVKNIKEPVRVYKVLMGTDTPKPLVEKTLELPDKPSIAVLPFDNMSGDPGQEYFSDGLTEQIINGLCKVSNLFVIARNSSFAYKGKAVSVKLIAKELGVRYILEGSVQRAGDRVRITAQLIDATTDYHMWSESYDRDLEDIFALQDEITMKLISVMEVKLTFGEQAISWARGMPKQLKSYDSFMKGNECLLRFNQIEAAQAKTYYLQAISIEPSAAMPHALLALAHLFDLIYGWSDSPIDSFQKAEEYAESSKSLNKDLDLANAILGWIYLYHRKHDLAIKYSEQAVRLNPNGAEVLVILGCILSFSGQPDVGEKKINNALRLNPLPPSYYYDMLATSQRNNKQYEKAIEACKRSIRMNPKALTPHLTLASSYSLLERYEEAKSVGTEIIKIDPNFSVSYYA